MPGPAAQAASTSPSSDARVLVRACRRPQRCPIRTIATEGVLTEQRALVYLAFPCKARMAVYTAQMVQQGHRNDGKDAAQSYLAVCLPVPVQSIITWLAVSALDEPLKPRRPCMCPFELSSHSDSGAHVLCGSR